jgi:hypothetical protein
MEKWRIRLEKWKRLRIQMTSKNLYLESRRAI